MPVMKHLTKRQKKRKKSQGSASANENKSDKNEKSSAGEQTPAVKQNPTANGVFHKAAAVKAVYRFQVPRSSASSQTPPCVNADLEAVEPNVWRVRMVIRYATIEYGFVALIHAFPLADRPRISPLIPEMPPKRNQKNSYNNNTNNTNTNNNITNNKIPNNNNRHNSIQQLPPIPEEDPERDKYYGRHPPNRVLGHLISAKEYKKIQGAYDKFRLVRLEAKKNNREKLEALADAAAAAAAFKLLKPESAEAASTPEISAEAPAPELHSADGLKVEAAPLYRAAGEAAPLNLAAGHTAPPDLAAGDAAPPLDFPAGEATLEDLAAAVAEARLMMGLGPLPFQGKTNGCLDWMPQTETPKASVPTVKPQMKPIGYEMLEKKHKLSQLTDSLKQQKLDAELDVLHILFQMDPKDLVNMSPKDLERAIIATGFEISELAYGPPELPNWMCQAILKILDKPEEPKPIWGASSVLSPNNNLPDLSPDFYPPFSGSQIRAEIERAMAQVPERTLYPVQEPTYAGVQMPPTYENIQVPPKYENIQVPTTYKNIQVPPKYENIQVPTTNENIQVPTTYETFQMPPTYEAVQGPPTYDFAPMYDPQCQQVHPQEAQIQIQSNLPSASVDNNHICGQIYYRGENERVGQTQRDQNGQHYRQHEINNNNNINNNINNNNINKNNINNNNINNNNINKNNNYNHMPQYFQDINSIMTPQNQMAPVESHHNMMPMGNPPAQHYGQYQNMPDAPMGYQHYPGPQAVHQLEANQAANFVAPPLINQFNNNNHNNENNNNHNYNYYNNNNQNNIQNNNHNNNQNNNNYAPMMPPPMNLNSNFQTNVNVNNNIQQLPPQQQKFKKSGIKFSTWGAPNSPKFVQFTGGPGGALRMASGHPTQYAPTYGVNMPLQIPRAPANEYDLTLSDSNFPPLPDPFKTRPEKGKPSNN